MICVTYSFLLNLEHEFSCQFSVLTQKSSDEGITKNDLLSY